ncbi:MAG: (uracil-5)-methyltransferase [Hyphomicrobium sp.]|nr:MAG: (uracil-5)-methyltransferase [Hyphomicrobium sp.]
MAEVEIVRLGAQGDGIAEMAGGPIFVPFALPGERWKVTNGEALRVTSSPERVAPPCPHFGICGGCAVQHMSDAAYVAWKKSNVAEAFRHRGLDVEIAPMLRVASGSRRRAVLGAALKGRDVVLGLREEGEHKLVDLDACVVMDPAIVAVFHPLRAMVRLLLAPHAKSKKRSNELNARLTVTRLDAGLDVSIGVSRGVLPPDLSAGLATLADHARLVRLSVDGDTIYMRGRPVLTVGGVATEPPPSVFLQAVPEAEAKLAGLVIDAVGKSKRVADLFSGIGTFTFPLARKSEVLALDGDKKAIAALDYAAKHAQGLKLIEARVRDLFREPLSRTELVAFDAVVFDPPRAGASAQAASLAKSKVPLVVAVSCNPATLARDVRVLVDGGYGIVRVTPVDQFVFTPHVEVVAVLKLG